MENGKLIAAEPRHRISFMGASAQTLGQHAQHGVAGRVAERVVEPLEPVEIDEEQHDAATRRPIFGHCRVQALAKERAIGQIGQPVVMGHVADALALELLVCHVLGNAQQILGLSVLVADDDHPRAQIAQAVVRRVHGLRLDDLHLLRVQNLAIAGDEPIGLLLGKNLMVGLADDGLPGNAEKLLPGPVQENEAEIAGVFDEDHGGNILDDRVEEFSRADQRAETAFGLGFTLSFRRRCRIVGRARRKMRRSASAFPWTSSRDHEWSRLKSRVAGRLIGGNRADASIRSHARKECAAPGAALAGIWLPPMHAVTPAARCPLRGEDSVRSSRGQ